MRWLTVLVLCGLSLMHVGCQDRSFVYYPTLSQGRPITEKAIHQVHLGMSKKTVARILGTPALVDAFDENQWFYIETTRKQLHHTQFKGTRLQLIFKNNHLQTIRRLH